MPELCKLLRDPLYADAFRFWGAESEADLRSEEQRLGSGLPADVREMLLDIGPVDIGAAAILGSGRSGTASISDTVADLRGRRPRLPPGMVPIAASHKSVGILRWDTMYVCLDMRRAVGGEPGITEWTPRARWRERVEQFQCGFRRWLAQQLEMLTDGPLQPYDWEKDGAWDRYWQQVCIGSEWLSRKLAFDWLTHDRTGIALFVDRFRERELHTVLCAGNGLSLAPYIQRLRRYGHRRLRCLL